MRRTRRPYVLAIGKRSTPPTANPSMPPAGPPRASQSSISTSQPTPIIVPNPNVKYSMVDRPPLKRVDGMPFDGGTSYRPGARLGPREIRNQSSLIRPYNYFQKVAPFDRLNVADVGDIDAPPVSIEKCYDAVEAGIGAIADAGARPIVVGGDPSITPPALRALPQRHGAPPPVQVASH